MEGIAGVLLLGGSSVFGFGAWVGVPEIFREPDPERRLQMLHEQLLRWRLAQPFYALGPLVASAGVGCLASSTRAGTAHGWLALSALSLVLGALCWCWSVYLRGTRFREFALRTLPGWPFTIYVLLTIGGLALLGVGLLASEFPTWLGWLTLVADAIFLSLYAMLKDIPPFMFHILLSVVGVAVMT